MKPLENIFDFYISSSIHVALGVVALTAVTIIHFDFSFDEKLLGFIFFGTITGYNFVKYAGVAQLYHRSLTKNLKIIQIFSFFCFLALCLLAFQVELRVLWVAGGLGIFTLLYALPIFSERKNLRDIAGLKVFVIAFIWAGVTVFFPVADVGFEISLNVVVEFFQRFLFVLLLILPFEIRDLKYDQESLKTIPQRLGVEKSKVLGYLLIFFWVVLEIFKSNPTTSSITALLFAAIVTVLVIYKSKEDQSPYFASFWVEGIPILWLGILLLFERF